MKKEELMFWALIITLGLFLGCGAIKAIPTPTQAIGAVSVAQGLLHSLDTFYNDLVIMQLLPDHRQEATKALAMADQAAEKLRKILGGLAVSDLDLNVLAGQVSGSKAILQGIK